MPGWSSSNRRARLPGNWKRIRSEVLRRDEHRCKRCGRSGDELPEGETLEVDHVIPNDNHSADNLQTLCTECHKAKSSREGQAAYWAAIKKSRNKFRTTEQHPGRLI